MRKVGVRDENYPLKKFYVRWVRFCVYIVAWRRPTLALAQANFGPVLGGRLPTGGRYARSSGSQHSPPVPTVPRGYPAGCPEIRRPAFLRGLEGLVTPNMAPGAQNGPPTAKNGVI